MTFSSLDIYLLVELIVKSKYTVQENALPLQKQSHDLHIFVSFFLVPRRRNWQKHYMHLFYEKIEQVSYIHKKLFRKSLKILTLHQLYS